MHLQNLSRKRKFDIITNFDLKQLFLSSRWHRMNNFTFACIMDCEIKFSDVEQMMENNSLHSTHIDFTPKSERNTITLKNIKDDSKDDTINKSPLTPLHNSLPHYDRNSRLGNHPFRRI